MTFTLKKVGQTVGDGALLSGEVEVRDIGIPADLRQRTVCPVQTVEADFVKAALPARKPDGHKGDFGKLLIVGGAVGCTGAPYLTASAAERSGCGLVYLGVPEGIWAVEAAKCVSSMPFPLPEKQGLLSYKALHDIEEKLSGCDVLALGPGLGRGEQVTRLVCELLTRTEKPVVLDADGINALTGHIDILDRRRGRVTVLTPHDGEFARIGGELSHGDRVRAARDFAMAHGCILVLKGHRTVTAAPGRERPGEHHRKLRPCQGRQRRCIDGRYRVPAGPGGRGGPGSGGGGLAPRTGRRPGGGPPDGLRHDAGGHHTRNACGISRDIEIRDKR